MDTSQPYLANLEATLHIPTPIERLCYTEESFKDIEVYMKCDDLIHPLLCGNKWRKLKYNLQAAIQNKHQSLISFGGAYSNHLIAIAYAGSMLNISTVGMIRSYTGQISNPTIEILRKYNMELVFVHPSVYREKEQHQEIIEILKRYPDHYLIPEGGTNLLALKGVGEMIGEIDLDELGITHIVVGLGTGGTLAGIVNAVKNDTIKVLGISPFKGEITSLAGIDFIDEDIKDLYDIIPCQPQSKFGSYSIDVSNYMEVFKLQFNVQLDPIYTVKVMRTLEHLVRQNYFEKGAKILVIHTGGMQGVSGYEQRYSKK